MRAYRHDRLTRSRVTFQEAADEITERAYLKASAGGKMWATARQVYYAARQHIQRRTGKKLRGQYFTQQLLPDYINKHGVQWGIAYDDRGHFREPHSKHDVGLGTLNVKKYLEGIRSIEFRDTETRSARVVTHGPAGSYHAILFCEKEGFMPLFEDEKLAERFDIGTMSTKGVSVTAARQLIDTLCGRYGVQVFCLHDFDKSGFTILATLQQATRRYSFTHNIRVIDIGLRLADVRELGLEGEAEEVFDEGSEYQRRANLRENGATAEEIEFLLQQRVELNVMPSDQLMEFIERKLKEHGVKKVVPGQNQLVKTYKLFARGRRIEEVIEETLEKEDEEAVVVPKDLDERVRTHLEDHPEDRWSDAVAAIAGLDVDDDDDDGDDE
jgi:hypothetical protein